MSNDSNKIPDAIARKMPWWAYLLMTLAPMITGYGGSLLGASQQAQANAVEIVELKGSIAAQTTVLDRQNDRITRLIVVIAAHSDVDVDSLLGKER